LIDDKLNCMEDEMKRSLIVLLSLVGFVAALPAMAQFRKAEEAIEYRQSAFTLIGTHFGRVAAMAQGKVPFDAKLAAENAAILNTLSSLPFSAFGEDTDKGKPNRAKAEIWQEMPKFRAAADKMIGEVAKLDIAAKTGNLEQIKSAVGAVGQSCKACHDNFRAERK